jgi:hypothetical protein
VPVAEYAMDCFPMLRSDGDTRDRNSNGTDLRDARHPVG